jgi:hypothetical protein
VSSRYTLLGWVVWHVAKWFAKRKARQNRGRMAAIATIVGVLVAGIVLARATNDE